MIHSEEIQVAGNPENKKLIPQYRMKHCKFVAGKQSTQNLSKRHKQIIHKVQMSLLF